MIEAQRKGAFDSVVQLYRYAAGEERDAIARYGEFAAQLDGPVADAFRRIEMEESGHLKKLNEMIAELDGQTNHTVE